MRTIGIDEVGRGALAGPIVVAAVSIPKGFYPRRATLPKLRDSKRLSPNQRLLWFRYIKNHPRIIYATARIYPRKIEKLNIANCANLAALRTLYKVIPELNHSNFIRNSKPLPAVFLDGSLYLGKRSTQPSFAKTIVRGDEKFISIKLASIVAKVIRDNYMINLHKKYPRYQLHIHKGYGTALHRARIKRFGPAETHRLTYLKEYRTIP